MAGWLVGQAGGWLAGWLRGWVAGWPAGWSGGWLIGWLFGWLAGRQVSKPSARFGVTICQSSENLAQQDKILILQLNIGYLKLYLKNTDYFSILLLDKLLSVLHTLRQHEMDEISEVMFIFTYYSSLDRYYTCS